MQQKVDVWEADDGFGLRRFQWLPSEGAPVAVVQILHGLAEHAARYERLAEALAGAGFAVVAHDHRGHGGSVRDERDRGHFADEGGWDRAVRDALQVRQSIGADFEGLPVVLLGHSMGSSLALWALAQAGHLYRGAVLSGPTGVVGPIRLAGLAAARLERWRLGPRTPSPVLHQLSFGDFNRGFEGRTAYDWLSRDPAQVDAYADDPWCGFMVTTQHWIDHLEALGAQSEPGFLARIPSKMPILILTGDRDPVSKGGAQVRVLHTRMITAGLVGVDPRYVEGGRHELFNDTCREEVIAALLAWVHGVVRA